MIGRLAITGFAILLNLLPLLITLDLWRYLVQAHFGGPYTVADISYGSALFISVWTILTWGSILASLRSKASSRWLILPLVSGIIAVQVLPGGHPFYPSVRLRQTVEQRIAHVAYFLDAWAAEKGRLPATQEEVQQAARLESAPSPYARDGARLPYRVVLVANAPGPVLQPTIPDPGVFYYALSSAGDRSWLTMAVLEGPSAERAVILREYNAPQVMEGKAPEKPNAQEPKAEGASR
ncbi:MAG: hypothetical protein ACRD24_06610 [Terriglobales bacterium]